MKMLFRTPRDKLLTIATLLVIVMIIFPPVSTIHDGSYSFRGYEFALDLYRSRFIDIGRLMLQLIGLGAITALIYRALATPTSH